MLDELLKSFITLFVIMDPFGCVSVFAGLTKGLSLKERIQNANRAVFVAGILFFIFLFFGGWIFNFFGINTSSFMIAGGVILLVMGILYALGYTNLQKKQKGNDVGSVPIGTPLLTGPGVITSAIILVKQYGLLIPIIAGTLSLLISWILLQRSGFVFRIIGDKGANILSRIMGIILSAIAVEFIKNGILTFI